MLLAQSNLKEPVILSTSDAGAGPMATTVAVPDSTCVRPASRTTKNGTPIEAAPATAASSAARSGIPTAIFFVPHRSSHCPYHATCAARSRRSALLAGEEEEEAAAA